MRTFLILFLTAALLLAAGITRPGKREFMLHLLDRPAKGDPWSHAAIHHADREIKQITFKNRLLWTEVQKDGKTLYTGVFSLYIPHTVNLENATPTPSDLAKLLAHAK